MALDENLNNARNSARGVNEEIASLYDQLRGVTSEIKGQATEISKAREAFRAFEKGAQDLKLQQEGINKLSDDQVQKLNDQLTKQRAIAAQEVERLKNSNSFIRNLDEEISQFKEVGSSQQEIADYALEQIRAAQDLSDEQKAILSSFYDQSNVMDEIVVQAQAELGVRNDVNKALGVTGGVLKGLNEIGGGFTKAFKLDKVAADMEEFADQTIRAEGSVSRLRVLGVGLQSAFKNAFATLTDPSVIIAGAIHGFKEVDKANVDFGRQTGQNLNTFSTAIDSSNTHFITMSDYIKTASELTKELGQNAAAIFGPEDLMEAAEMTEAMGMQSKEAAKLAQFSKINGGNIKAQNEALVKGVNAANRQNRTAVAAGDVLKDVANVSEEIAVSYAGYPGKLASAAATAKGLGMTLADVDKIAGSLLNFEESISKELEAELLTGQELNLEKARELALSNDLEGVAKELANQGVTSAKFSQMNRIQQEAQAAALGMSRQEMAKMLLAQEMANGLSEDALNDAQKATLEDLKREEASEKFAKAIEKLQQSLAPVVGFFADILTSVVGFLTQTKLIYPILGVIAAVYVAKMVKGFKGMKDDLKGMVEDAKSLAKSLFGKKEGGVAPDTGLGGGDQAANVAGQAGEGAGQAANKAKGVKGSLGKEIEQFLKGVGRGLKFIGQNFADIAKGGLALLLASPGLIAASLAAPGLFVLSMIPGPAINSALTGLGRGLSNFVKNFSITDALKFAASGLLLAAPLMAIGLAYSAMGGDPMVLLGLGLGLAGLAASLAVVGKFSSQILQGSLAIAVLGLALIPAAFAFSLLQGLDVEAMIAFSVALPLLALAAAGLGFIAPFIMAGAGALAVLGLALIPAGIAFSMLQGLDPKAIVSFAAGVGILAGTVALLGFAAPLIIAGSAAIAILGLAMVPLSLGFQQMADADMQGMVGSLSELASLAPGLTATAAALFAVAGGMTAVAVAGYLAVPAMALMSLFSADKEEGSKKDEGSLRAVEEKLDQLIAVVSAGGDVFIDGSKVGKTLSLASSKMG